MQFEWGPEEKVISSNKSAHLLQVIIYLGIALYCLYIEQSKGRALGETSLIIVAIVFAFFGIFQLYSMFATKVVIYEKGIFIHKTLRKACIPFDAIEYSTWGKLKYVFFTISNYIIFYYVDERGKIKKFTVTATDIPKSALRNISVEYADKIKYNGKLAQSGQRYSGYSG